MSAISDRGGSEASATKKIRELIDVLSATDTLLGTIDLDNVSNVVDADELPSLVNVDGFADALEQRNLDLAFDLSRLENVVDKRELWNSVDLVEFAKAKRTVDRELGDLLGENVPGGGGGENGSGDDSEAVSEVKEFASSLRPEAKEVAIQQEAQRKAEVLRDAVVDQHARLERLYESNRKRFGNASEGTAAQNPTAVSLLPSGPLPSGVSTRVSTVPSELPYARIDALPRIYGRRWRRRRSQTGRIETRLA